MTSTLNDKGKGIYEGNGVLESGGTWQARVVVRRGGQVLGTKQFSVNAEGGM
jgi:Cu(I)/Ag(I) efflux system membrane fusion protein/cobalt-zinc-cadmium efflux system membrane fusion protein